MEAKTTFIQPLHLPVLIAYHHSSIYLTEVKYKNTTSATDLGRLRLKTVARYLWNKIAEKAIANYIYTIF